MNRHIEAEMVSMKVVGKQAYLRPAMPLPPFLMLLHLYVTYNILQSASISKTFPASLHTLAED